MTADCFVCRKHRGEIADPGRLHEDGLTYVGHVVPDEGTTAYLGHLIVEPKRHAEHVVPRWPETPDDIAWHRVDEWEGARRGGADEIAAFARRLPY